MEKGLERATTSGVPQGGPLSVCIDLNYRIDVEVENPEKVAREFLEEIGLLSK